MADRNITGDSTDRKNENRHARQKTVTFLRTILVAFIRPATGR